MKRRSFLATLGAAAAATVINRAPLAADGNVETVRPRLRLLSCNIRIPQPIDEQQGDGWDARKELCARVIQSQNADVICFQECQRWQLGYLLDRSPDFSSYGMANPGPEFHPVNAIAFHKKRFEQITAGGFWLSETPHVAGSISWHSARPRFVNWLELCDRRTKRLFRVWNTHLDHKGQQAREEQARVIVEACRVFPTDLPQLLAGDMNADVKNPAIRVLTDGGWNDTYAAVNGPDDPGFTFHAFLGPKYPNTNNRGKIDWIFARGPVKPLAASVIRHGENGRFPSDHYFVSADVSL